MKPCAQYDAALSSYLHWQHGLPYLLFKCPRDSLNLPTFSTPYLDSPCVSPLWFSKVSWCHTYRTIKTASHFLLNKSELGHISIQREVYACLEAMFSSKRIRHAGAVPWISCSPHLDTFRFSSLEIREGCGVHTCDAYTPPSAAAEYQTGGN